MNRNSTETAGHSLYVEVQPAFCVTTHLTRIGKTFAVNVITLTRLRLLCTFCTVLQEHPLGVFHTKSEKFENAALFNDQACRARYDPARKHQLCVEVWTENGAFRKRWLCVIFSAQSLIKHKCKMSDDCCVFKFLRGRAGSGLRHTKSWMEKDWELLPLLLSLSD